MSQRLPVTPAPEPLEAYAFDTHFSKRNQQAFVAILKGCSPVSGTDSYSSGE